MQITIDGRQVEAKEGRTILQVARENAIHIPTLCYHEALQPFGACRLCVVEIETSRDRTLVTSCTYPCSEGLVVHTASDAVLRSRRITVELLMASAQHVPLIQQLAAELGVREPRFTLPENACILCGLCVRACNEIVGVGAISVINRGIDKKVSPPFHIASNACVSCGTCVLICPTGAITLADINGGAETAHNWDSGFETVSCQLCGHHALQPIFADHMKSLAIKEPPAAMPAGEAVP
jgi:NADH dehydrogenase/NADH:ubiquinone oxidoreductase subunit G